MLKALLIDDEINILRNFQSVIPWEDIGIEIVGLAENGAKAMELVDIYKPDIVLSDISMPVMDGITFVQKLRERDTSCECIMLTGYQSFEYARSLMRYGVKEYLMKPINYEELERVVRRVAESILERRQKARNEEKAWGNVVSLVYEKILYDFLMNYTSITNHPLLTAEVPHLDETEYMLLLVDLEHYAKLSFGWDEKEQRLWNFAIYNVLREALILEKRTYTVLQMRQGEWCLLIEQVRGEKSDVEIDQAKKWANHIRECVKSNVKLEVSVGIYSHCLPISGLAAAYKRVQWEIHLSPGCNTIVTSKNPSCTTHLQIDVLWQITEDMISALKQFNRVKTEEVMEALNVHLKTIPDSLMLRVQQILHYLVLNLLREMREFNMFKQLEEESIWDKLSYSISAKDLLVVMNEMVNQCLDVFVSKKSNVALMESAKAYIHERMAKDLGIDELASTLGISNSYFSLLFKQHFGVTFVEYLTKLRMETAKSMLEEKERRVAQISESVGYLDGRYFIKIFHRYTGMTPSEYRASRKNIGCFHK
ncbi:response regulator [Paenibacillus frigoriresistens]|uniref:response regulator transcription factor n=1 Tax=Paenibacillus alginolyticus TaxID=59839 RepID=UPI00156688A0|nr:response regulator [Paenibacillus frigoriresistens]NRF90645.1 response regulator [Paenibacillus frigoriresistens]